MRLLGQRDISYDEYEHYFPMADELAHHLEEQLRVQSYEEKAALASELSHEQVASLVSFGA